MIPAHIRFVCVCVCDGREKKKDYVNMYKIINRKVINWDQLFKKRAVYNIRSDVNCICNLQCII